MKNLLLALCMLTLVVFMACTTDDTDDTIPNEPPTFSDQTFTVPEDEEVDTIIGVITADDPEGATLTFSLVSGNTDDTFGLKSIQSTSGNAVALTLESELDFESITSYELGLEVSDGENEVTATVTVEVTDVEDETGVSGYAVEIGGTEYVFKNGIIEDYGSGDFLELGFTHTNYDFTLVTVDDIFTPPDNFALIYSELVSAGDSFQAGTFNFVDDSVNPNTLEGENFFLLHTIAVVENDETVEGYGAVGGTITVTGDGLDDYTISYDLQLREVDLVNEVLVGEAFSFQFEFSDADGFNYFDETSRLADALKLAKWRGQKHFGM